MKCRLPWECSVGGEWTKRGWAFLPSSINKLLLYEGTKDRPVTSQSTNQVKCMPSHHPLVLRRWGGASLTWNIDGTCFFSIPSSVISPFAIDAVLEGPHRWNGSDHDSLTVQVATATCSSLAWREEKLLERDTPPASFLKPLMVCAFFKGYIKNFMVHIIKTNVTHISWFSP